MKTICIIAGGGNMILRYYLRGSLLKLLTAQNDVRVVLLVLESEQEAYSQEFTGKRIEVVGMPQVTLSRWFLLLISFSRAAFHPKLNKVLHWVVEHDQLHTKLYKVYIKRFIAYTLGLWPIISHPLQHIVRVLILKIRAPRFLESFFDKYKPDVVFATSIIQNTSFDLPIVCEAKRRGIKTVVTTRGWDAYSYLGFLLVHPDHLMAQSAYVKEMAVKYHLFPPERITITGFPHFDLYHRRDLIMPREIFLKSLGIDSKKRFILLGAVGGIYHEREFGFAEIVDELAATGQIPEDVMVLFRMHPNWVFPPDKFWPLKSVVVDTLHMSLPGPGHPEADLQSVVHQMNSLYHSEFLLSPGGTIVFDAIAFGRPVIDVAFDGKKFFPYRYSIVRLHDGTYFDWPEIDKCGGMRVVKTTEELTSAINEHLDDPSKDTKGRECIRKRFFEPFDGKSTERLANTLLSFL